MDNADKNPRKSGAARGRPPATSKLPMYAQIQQHVRNEIAAGRLREGDQIPTEAELCEQFGAARATVAKAIQQLAFEGLIVRRAGSGSFVAVRTIGSTLELPRVTSFEEQVGSGSDVVTYEVIGFSKRAVGEKDGTSLGLRADVDIFQLKRLRLVNESRMSLEVRTIPLEIGRRMTIDMLHTRSMHQILEELQRPVLQVRGKIRASVADAALASHLNLQEGSAVLIRDYVLLGGDDSPLVCGESFYRPELHIEYMVGEARLDT